MLRICGLRRFCSCKVEATERRRTGPPSLLSASLFIPVALAAALAIPGSAAAARAACPVGSLYSASKAVLQACAPRILPLRSISSLSGGGKEYKYGNSSCPKADPA
jgi:hypothetical protein